MGLASRMPNSNELPPASNSANPWSDGDEFYDAVCRQLNGLAKRCKKCLRITALRHLTQGHCPDCKE